ncbi:MAG: hypothetical protein ACLR6B_21915 [Blautia sp.]
MKFSLTESPGCSFTDLAPHRRCYNAPALGKFTLAFFCPGKFFFSVSELFALCLSIICHNRIVPMRYFLQMADCVIPPAQSWQISNSCALVSFVSRILLLSGAETRPFVAWFVGVCDILTFW